MADDLAKVDRQQRGDDQSRHSVAVQLITSDYQADRINQKDAMDDLKFLAGDQWKESERQQREREGRPCLTINHLGGFTDVVAGELRQSQMAIQVFPVDNREDKQIAQIYQGLIRQIEYQSDAVNGAYATGADGAIGCGIGHWRISTRRTQDSPFLQEICINEILDPLTVLWDANSVKRDRSDAKRCWVMSWVHESAWKRMFPKANRSLSNVPTGDDAGGSSGLYWRRDNFVRIAEYWWIEPAAKRWIMLDTGQTFDVTEWAPEQIEALRVQSRIVEERTGEGTRVQRRMMDGAGWLGPKEDWAGQYIPIVPVMGKQVAFDGKIVRKGLIRDAKDPQKLLNYWRSAAAEMVGKQPKTPWQGTQKMFAGLEAYYTASNRTNVPILPFHPDPDLPGIMPKRTDPPQLPTAMLQQAQMGVDDMKATTKIYDASLGAESPARSGIAIGRLQQQGNIGSFIYSTNYQSALKRTGVILVDLIPRIYDTERQIRILQPDESEQYVPINVTVMDDNGEPMLVNDLSNRRFDVKIAAGTSYMTARHETQELMATALQTNPGLWSVIGDLVFKGLDYPGSEEIAERIRRTIPEQILQDQPQQQAQPDPVAELLQRLTLAGQQAQIAKTEADAEKSRAAAQKTLAEIPGVAAETEKTIVETDGQEIENEANMEQLEANF